MNIPNNLSYIFIVHAGSYKDFVKKLDHSFPDLKIKYEKKKSVHYYILQVEEINTTTEVYDKDEIYNKLPLMAMREEFSNFIFFKSTKAYNNVLKIMLFGKENKKAPFDLFQEMLTVHEKYKMSGAYDLPDKTKENYELSFDIEETIEGTSRKEIRNTTYFGIMTFEEEVKKLMFETDKVIVRKKECNFAEEIKADTKLTIGII